jgi:hypothetical protein
VREIFDAVDAVLYVVLLPVSDDEISHRESPLHVLRVTASLTPFQQTTGKLSGAYLIEVARGISTHQRSRVWVHLEPML